MEDDTIIETPMGHVQCSCGDNGAPCCCANEGGRCACHGDGEGSCCE